MDELQPRSRRGLAVLLVLVGSVAVLLVLAMGVGLWVLGQDSASPVTAGSPSPSNTSTSASPSTPSTTSTSPSTPSSVPNPSSTLPPVGLEESPTRLLPAPTAASSRAYRISDRQDDRHTPITWSPCRPIHYVMGTQEAPEGALALVQEGFDRLSEATGLKFVYDGTTDERPSQDREAYQPQRYGQRWAPVLVSWATAKEFPDLAADVVGAALPEAYSDEDGIYHYVTGDVTLDVEDYQTALDEGDTASVRSTLLHELGHLAGLDHVRDDAQLMYPDITDVSDYARGDLAGLAIVGSGPCAPTL